MEGSGRKSFLDLGGNPSERMTPPRMLTHGHGQGNPMRLHFRSLMICLVILAETTLSFFIGGVGGVFDRTFHVFRNDFRPGTSS